MSKLRLFINLLIVGILIVIGASMLGLFAYSGFVLTHTSNPDDLLVIWFLFPKSLGIIAIGSVVGVFVGRLSRSWQIHGEKQSNKNLFLGETWGGMVFSAFYWLWWIYQYTLSQFYRS